MCYAVSWAYLVYHELPVGLLYHKNNNNKQNQNNHHKKKNKTKTKPTNHKAGQRAGALGMAFAALQLSEALAPGTVPVEILSACRDAAPARLRRMVDRLTPATAHRVVRRSLAEKFVWQRSGLGLAHQLIAEIVPAGATTLGEAAGIYRTRAMKLLHAVTSPLSTPSRSL